jgi:hypothetical protein
MFNGLIVMICVPKKLNEQLSAEFGSLNIGLPSPCISFVSNPIKVNNLEMSISATGQDNISVLLWSSSN